MNDSSMLYVVWAMVLGAISAVSLPLGSLVGLNVRFRQTTTAIFAAFGAGALIAALSVELVAPTAFAVVGADHAGGGGHALAHFYALLIGGVVGGLLFVTLDAVVNRKGGYLRKTATTVAYLAERRRGKARELIQQVVSVPPFDALPDDLAQGIASLLKPVEFARGETVLTPSQGPTEAYIILTGEMEVEIAGRSVTVFGPGTMCLVAALLVPDLTGLGTITAKGDVRCLAISREDVDHLRALSPAFDEACRRLAAERMTHVEQHVVARLGEAVDRIRSAAAAVRLGEEVPALAIRRTHAGHAGSPLAVWLGILLDGIPESIVIGAGLFVMMAIHTADTALRFADVIPYTLIAGLFLSNFPEALSSSANMLAAGWNRRRIFLMWFALLVVTSVGAGLGYLLAGVLSETWLVFAEGVAAGAMLTMIAAAMIPEAAEHGNPSAVGLSTLAGFLAAVLFKLFE